MHNTVLLASQNEQLQHENQRQKRKREQKRSYITKGGVLSGAEAQSLLEDRENQRIELVEKVSNKASKRALRKCSLCSSLEHIARTCAKRQRTV